MSTTIHAQIEVKKDNRWLHFASPIVHTDYIFFAAINGEGIDYLRDSVREKIHPNASGKGLPDDISEVTAVCYQMDKESYHLHDEGFLSTQDLRNLQQNIWDIYYFDPKSAWDLEEHFFKTYINGNAIASHQGWDDVRIVFWYDH